MFRPGELDEQISFDREILTDDGIGGQEISIKKIASGVWAKVRPLSGSEQERYDKLNAVENTMFVVRYREDVQENDRIKWHGVEYNIRHIERGSRRLLYTKIIAERGVAQ